MNLEKENFRMFKYEPSRHIMDFHIAGFSYYEGIDVIDELSLGVSVNLISEHDNPYDPEAIAIYYKNKKIGYVPKDKNSLISNFYTLDIMIFLNLKYSMQAKSNIQKDSFVLF